MIERERERERSATASRGKLVGERGMGFIIKIVGAWTLRSNGHGAKKPQQRPRRWARLSPTAIDELCSPSDSECCCFGEQWFILVR